MAGHQRQRALLTGGLLDARTRKRSGAERDRKEGKHKLEDTGMDARPQGQRRGSAKYPAGRRVSGKTCENEGPTLRSVGQQLTGRPRYRQIDLTQHHRRGRR